VNRGSLTVVGIGYRIAGQITPEAESCIRDSQKLFYLTSNSTTGLLMHDMNPTAESLSDSYRGGKDRRETYREMVERILGPVRNSLDVCAAFDGHPGICAVPTHEAIRIARAEGFEATMLPGISAEDCLFADLGVDPARGCQSFEATDFVARHREIDPSSALILWQIGLVGFMGHSKKTLWSREGLVTLVDVLREGYPADHEIVVYEANQFPGGDPHIQRIPLSRLPKADVTIWSLLYVPPKAPRKMNRRMMARLGLA
jgi:uncharacterized protein YabN with tetrapyrrole methylase and pyrophosphatase domain